MKPASGGLSDWGSDTDDLSNQLTTCFLVRNWGRVALRVSLHPPLLRGKGTFVGLQFGRSVFRLKLHGLSRPFDQPIEPRLARVAAHRLRGSTSGTTSPLVQCGETSATGSASLAHSHANRFLRVAFLPRTLRDALYHDIQRQK